MKLGRPPIAPVLPIAMIGISARPPGSYRKNYTDFRHAWKGATVAIGRCRCRGFAAPARVRCWPIREDSCRCQASPVTEVRQSLLHEPRRKAGARKASGGGGPLVSELLTRFS